MFARKPTVREERKSRTPSSLRQSNRLHACSQSQQWRCVHAAYLWTSHLFTSCLSHLSPPSIPAPIGNLVKPPNPNITESHRVSCWSQPPVDQHHLWHAGLTQLDEAQLPLTVASSLEYETHLPKPSKCLPSVKPPIVAAPAVPRSALRQFPT